MSGCCLVAAAQHIEPTGLDQGDHFSAGLQFQALGAVVGDLRSDAQAFGQFKADPVVVALGFNGHHLAVQLVACAGPEHQATEQIEVAGVFSGLQDLGLQHLQLLIEA
ncbi:hypothetical protein D3C81_1760850 [compost metagenome]